MPPYHHRAVFLPGAPTRTASGGVRFTGRFRRTLLTALLIGVVAFLGGLPSAWPQSAPETTAVPAHLALARELLDALKPENNSYHRRGHLRWPEVDARGVRGEYAAHTTCSGLINGLLERAGNRQIAELRAVSAKGLPHARDYYRQIVAERGFKRIERLADARPGDLIAIEYPPGLPDTGHVMLIDAMPAPDAAGEPPTEGVTQAWRVEVIDSSKSPHGRHDTRINADGGKRNGVGRGALRMYTDGEGRPLGYRWSTRKTSRYYAPAERAVAIGRLE